VARLLQSLSSGLNKKLLSPEDKYEASHPIAIDSRRPFSARLLGYGVVIGNW
jgi:hypothetical protein